MISVSPEVFTVLSLGARYLFALMGLLIVARWLPTAGGTGSGCAICRAPA